jgi:hypothetical protein
MTITPALTGFDHAMTHLQAATGASHRGATLVVAASDVTWLELQVTRPDPRNLVLLARNLLAQAAGVLDHQREARADEIEPDEEPLSEADADLVDLLDDVLALLPEAGELLEGRPPPTVTPPATAGDTQEGAPA